MSDLSFLAFDHLQWIEELYSRYQREPDRLEASWRHLFAGLDLARELFRVEAGDQRVVQLVETYRRQGHLLAAINPIAVREKAPISLLQQVGFSEKDLLSEVPTLGLLKEPRAPLAKLVERLTELYGGRIGFEYVDFGNPAMEAWMRKKIESHATFQISMEEKQLLLHALNRAEAFETFLHTKYVGQKRFSLEGAETLIPMIREIVEEGAQQGVEEIVLGMAHRGRLNVLVNLLEKPYSLVFQEFEDTVQESGDVKYHKGFSSELTTRGGHKVHIHLAANPSHLESIDPVALGIARAKQEARRDPLGSSVLPLLIHGDASLAGQGVIYESLQFSQLPGYSTGGTLHIVINNQIGFTTLPEEGRSTTYCTDIAKTFGAPVFHVNAEDPEAVLFATRLAVEARQIFRSDLFLDLNGYRKYGHNEGDEPSFTQPIQYRLIRSKQSIREIYDSRLHLEGSAEREMADRMEEEFKKVLSEAFQEAKGGASPFREKESSIAAEQALFTPVVSCVSRERLQSLTERFIRVPSAFSLHPKLLKWLEQRKESLSHRIDWATAEFLALASLLVEGTPVRFTGQDVRRGTFNQRHLVWIDQETMAAYAPLSHLQEGQAPCAIYNSPLSEFAALAFEYGYSSSLREALSIWEAQYGDFANGAQILIDQYLAAGEKKWDRFSSLVLLLPHGYEGQGPEHSSARIERFLQLAANANLQIVYPSTPAQYFHLLRRQAIRSLKKPLIVFTPKALLRSAACTSSLEELTQGTFEEILEEKSPCERPEKFFFCTGKIYYELLERRKGNELFLRIEELYPLHLEKLQKIIAKYPSVSQFFWIQEEPENMGAWESMRPYFLQLGISLSYIGRERSASTAAGSFRKHTEELEKIFQKAFA